MVRLRRINDRLSGLKDEGLDPLLVTDVVQSLSERVAARFPLIEPVQPLEQLRQVSEHLGGLKDEGLDALLVTDYAQSLSERVAARFPRNEPVQPPEQLKQVTKERRDDIRQLQRQWEIATPVHDLQINEPNLETSIAAPSRDSGGRDRESQQDGAARIVLTDPADIERRRKLLALLAAKRQKREGSSASG
ncbi:MAG: hypothetical protein ACR2JG_04875 [Geodermatophilaceae bacterium]